MVGAQEETAFSAPASRGVRKGGAMGGISSDDETDSDEDEMERIRTLSIRTGACVYRFRDRGFRYSSNKLQQHRTPFGGVLPCA